MLFWIVYKNCLFYIDLAYINCLLKKYVHAWQGLQFHEAQYMADTGSMRGQY